MFIKQLSIFLENRVGRLSSITRILEESGIDIRALCIADTADFGIMRLIVNDPDKAYNTLKEAGYTVSVTQVLAIGIEDKPGGLAGPMEVLNENKISVEYMYAFLSKTDNIAFVILRVEDNTAAAAALQKNSVKILTSEEIYKM